MKWLGQYVQSFTARFRSDVYLEDISSGTIVSGGHLGLDSNDKIVKAVDGGGDLTSIVAGAGMTGTSLTGPIPTLNVIGGDGITANANDVAVRADQTTITSIYNTELKIGNSSTDSLIAFNVDEKMSFMIAGEEQIALQDGALSPKVHNDVDLGKEEFRWKDIYAHGTVHSAGGFSGNLTGNASGSSGTVTSIGNLTGEVTSTNRATVIAGDVVDEANLKCSNGPTNGHFLSAQSGNTGGLTWAAIPTLNQNTTGQAGTVATIAGLAPNTAPTGTFVLPATAASQANITTLTGLTTVGTTGATFNIQSDNIISINPTSSKPEFALLNITDDASASVITFVKQKIITSAPYIAAGLDNDVVGTIDFQGKGDNLSEDTDFARIYADIHDASDATISGRLNLQVEAHGGGLESGLVLTGGSQDDEVDVTVGLGADSVVTIPGNIDLAGDIDVDGTLEVDAFKGTGSTTITNILDEDAMGSNSATALATQQSIKAYADTKVSKDTTRQLTHHTIVDDIDNSDGTGTPIFISLGQIDAENTSATNKNLPLLAPVAGKLLKVFIRSSSAMNTVDLTFKLYTRTVAQSTNGTAAEVGAKLMAGPTNKTQVTFDFEDLTTTGASGTNAIAAGDKVLLSIESSGATSNSTMFISCLWEWDLS